MALRSIEEAAGPVLIVDDEEDVVNAIRRALRREGFETLTATTMPDIEACLATHSPSVVTLDLSMPHITGFEVIQEIRRNPKWDDVKILVISALPRTDLEVALSLGADDILEKPFEKDVLLQKLRYLVAETSDVYAVA